jgi:hypothetical protein
LVLLPLLVLRVLARGGGGRASPHGAGRSTAADGDDDEADDDENAAADADGMQARTCLVIHCSCWASSAWSARRWRASRRVDDDIDSSVLYGAGCCPWRPAPRAVQRQVVMWRRIIAQYAFILR